MAFNHYCVGSYQLGALQLIDLLTDCSFIIAALLCVLWMMPSRRAQ